MHRNYRVLHQCRFSETQCRCVVSVFNMCDCFSALLNFTSLSGVFGFGPPCSSTSGLYTPMNCVTLEAILYVCYSLAGKKFTISVRVVLILFFNPLKCSGVRWLHLKCSMPSGSDPPLLIFDIRALWHSALSAIVPECQKLKMLG